jgi:acyl-CoA synthetase (NDP forming)
MSRHPLEEVLHPRSIAVVGASGRPGGGPSFLDAVIDFGFKGQIYPVNPKYSEIRDLKAYPSVKDIPGVVDYVISSIPAPKVPGMLADCAEKGVKAIHLFTARFSETGRQDATELEQEILKQARVAGIRLIGPNCMGVYYPGGGMSFSPDLPKESGSLGVASQSGSAIFDIVGLGAINGLRFSKAISYGNALDFNECDYLEYLTQDPETSIILMYIEGVRDGKRFFDILRETTRTKPVIIVKGGRGESGTRATASHTASLAGSMALWETAVKQAGALSAPHLEELMDIATAFHYLKPIHGKRVAVAGGAGGSSVLAADLCEEAGLDVIPLPQEIRETLKAQGNEIWDWIGNPADLSIRIDRNSTVGDYLKVMANDPNFDLLITFLHMHGPGNQKKITADEFLARYCLDELNNKPLLATMEDSGQGRNHNDHAWMHEVLEEAKEKLQAVNVPVYPSIERAATAASKMIDYYQHKQSAWELQKT